MARLLPNPQSDEAFDDADPTTDYTAALRVVATQAGLDASADPSRFDEGSVPVFAVDGHVAKLYPPSCGPAYENELAVLRHIAGALPLETPRVRAAAPLEGWHFIVMSRIPGRPLGDCYDSIPGARRRELFRDLGEAIGTLHRLPTVPLPHDDWMGILETRRAGCLARHRRLGLGDAWLERIEPFLDEVLPELDLGGTGALLHTELMRGHVFVDERDGRFELSGLIDFEPSQVGPAEYELASVGLFLSEGDGEAWSAFLDGLGVPAGDRGAPLARRSMAWALLHRYANLRWWLERAPARSPRGSFDDLALEWFSGTGLVG